MLHYDDAIPHILLTYQKVLELRSQVASRVLCSAVTVRGKYPLFTSMGTALSVVKAASKEACGKWLSEILANEKGFYTMAYYEVSVKMETNYQTRRLILETNMISVTLFLNHCINSKTVNEV